MSVLLTLELLDKLREIRRDWKDIDVLNALRLDECIARLEETERAVENEQEPALERAS